VVLHQSAWTGSVANQVLLAQDARLAMAGLLALNGPTPLDIRAGILYAPGLPLNVTGNSSTSPWQYVVAAGSYVSTKGNTDGPHVGTNDGVVLVSTTVPPGSNSRYDLVYVMQQDADATISPDASTVPLIGVVNGTPGASPAVPATPAGATVLATALVASSAAGGTSGAGVTINTAVSRYTTLRGAHIPVRNQAERDELTVRDGLQVYRLDLHLIETYNSALTVWFGGAWTVWTPVLTAVTTNPTLGTGGSTRGRYTMAGKGIKANGLITFGTAAATAGSGVYLISIPTGVFGPGYQFDDLVGYAEVKCAGLWTKCNLRYWDTTRVSLFYNTLAAQGAGTRVTNAAPGVFTNNDLIQLILDLEIA
jgi:hypothetical protein